MKNEMEDNNSQLCLKNKQDKKVLVILFRFGDSKQLERKKCRLNKLGRVLVE